jgi:hypothetical protein
MVICPDCQKETIAGSKYCPECGALMPAPELVQSDITTSPVTKGAIEPSPGQETIKPKINLSSIPNAGTFRRLTAGLIDTLVAMMFFYPSVRMGLIRSFMIGGIFLGLLPAVYLVLRDSFGGKSVGKAIMGLVAVNINEGTASGLADSILRNWFLFLIVLPPRLFLVTFGMLVYLFIGLIIAAQIIFGKKQRLGEKSAGTKVINFQLLSAASQVG